MASENNPYLIQFVEVSGLLIIFYGLLRLTILGRNKRLGGIHGELEVIADWTKMANERNGMPSASSSETSEKVLDLQYG